MRDLPELKKCRCLNLFQLMTINRRQIEFKVKSIG